jgi:pyruvate,water dikinase
MGLAIQEMIPARLSGVAFSRNPITGMDEIVVEAVEGSGIALMQEGITPQRWIWKWGKWLQQPEKTDVPQDLIQEIALEVRKISESFNYPVDVEWVFDGQRVIWLQMRKITTLQSIDIYANHIPKEFIPGVIKPLVWTVNVPLVNGVWVQLLTELIGKNHLDPLRLARSFYGYAYFNMGLLGSVFQQIGLPENALERLMGFEAEADYGPSFRPSLKALQHLPRMIKFIVEKARFDRKFENFFALAQKQYTALESQSLWELNDSDMENYVEQIYLLNQRTAYFNIVTPLLMLFYHNLAKRSLTRKGIDYENANWLEGWQDREDYNPVPHLRALGAIFNSIEPAKRQAALTTGHRASLDGLEEFNKHLQVFLNRFGHLSDNGNDFSFPLWVETPEVILNLIAGYDNNPPPENTEKTNSPKNEVPRGYIFQQASRYGRYREQISFLYTRGFSMFRKAFMRIGASFCESGWLDDAEDIFFLEYDEIFSAIRQKESEFSLCELVNERKKDHVRNQSITLPSVIYGDHLPPIQDAHSPILTGIPASRGRHRGIVRVVKGLGDFQKVTDDCVLVIPYSDVSWTPLFARAGALIAEAGGVLSHSSIVAREYGIPAIVSLPHATRLRDGIEVTVDGYSGNVILHDYNLEEEKNAG